MLQRLSQPDGLDEQIAQTETSRPDIAAASSCRGKLRVEVGIHKRRRDQRTVLDAECLDVGYPDNRRRESVQVHIDVHAERDSGTGAGSDGNGLDLVAI